MDPGRVLSRPDPDPDPDPDPSPILTIVFLCIPENKSSKNESVSI